MEFREMYEILQAIKAKDLAPAIGYLTALGVWWLMVDGQIRNGINWNSGVVIYLSTCIDCNLLNSLPRTMNIQLLKH